MTKNKVISSGHAKDVRGASGILDEVNEARKVVERVAEITRSLGHGVYTFHDDTSKTQRTNLNTIVKFHNSKTRELDVSIHFNALKKTDEPMGTEVLYYSESGKVEAQKVVDAIAKVSGLKNRGVKYRDNLFFLKNTEKPAILIEVCFVDSKADAEIYHDKFEEICIAIAEAITGEKYVKPEPKQKAPVKPEAKEKKYESLVDYLIDHDYPYDFVSRRKLAALHGIDNYNGSGTQNTDLLECLQRKH